MKKLAAVLGCLILLGICRWAFADVPFDETCFPDANFRKYLQDRGFDKDGNGSFSDAEISEIKIIRCTSKSISDMTGIEYFTELTELQCGFNQLNGLDVSKNTKLTILTCKYSNLTSLDISKNLALERLDFEDNKIETLDVSKHTALKQLDCSRNKLTSLDVSHNTALTSLYCGNNQLQNIDVSKNTALSALSCGYTGISSLDVSKNTELTILSCDTNNLTVLDLSHNAKIYVLHCDRNKLTSLDVTKQTGMEELSCSSNQLKSLDLSKNTKLEMLSCFSNQLTGLDVSKNTALDFFQCGENHLSSLDVSRNEKLHLLSCAHNNITELDLTNCPNLGFMISNIVPKDEGSWWNYDVSTSSDGHVWGLSFDKIVKVIMGNVVITPSITATPSPTPHVTASPTPSPNPTAVPVVTPTATPTAAPTAAPTGAPTAEPTNTPDPDLPEDGVSIDATHFPDPNFRKIVASFDTNSNGLLSASEISAVVSITCYKKNIGSLKGIEYFTALESLDCLNNHLSELDISKNKVLDSLDCRNNHLSELDISKNTALYYLDCSGNVLTELDVRKCPWLCQYMEDHERTSEEEGIDKFGNWFFVGSSVKVIGPYISKPTAEPTSVIEAGGVYEVINGKEAALAGLADLNASSLTIRDSVKIGSKTYAVTEIRNAACRNAPALQKLTLGKKVQVIGKNAFAGCTKLTTVKGGASIVTLMDASFSGCTALKTFPAMNKLQKISANAFKGAKALAKFTIAKTVNSIGKNAFNGCAGLKTITVKTEELTAKNVGSGAFKGIHKKATFKCPKKQLKAYKKLFVKKGAPKTCKFK